MLEPFPLLHVKPAVVPPLDPDFRPIALGNRQYRRAVAAAARTIPLTIALERNDGLVSTFRTELLPQSAGTDAETLCYVERLVKFLLWQKGGWRLVVDGPREIGEALRQTYSAQGKRAFDTQMMNSAYDRPFMVEMVSAGKAPAEQESASPLGGHLDGCRIGFDLGASDYKLAAVRDGEPVFSTELPWHPRDEADPAYHLAKIRDGLKLAATHLPRVDAIGGSSAGILVNNRVMVASLFRAVPKAVFEEKVKPLFLNLQKEWGVPLDVANDGDVTALAGAMSLKETALLGIAMGSSQAGGYLDPAGRITGWLNELAFAPVDYNPRAATDEWSGDIGCGALYFSQQAVVRLAPIAGIALPSRDVPGQLAFVQELHAGGDARAARIFETIGVYLGYALAQYADHYACRHLLVMGRVTSGAGGELIRRNAQAVLAREFPDLAPKLAVHLPDEKSRRVGQAVAAAALPSLTDGATGAKKHTR